MANTEQRKYPRRISIDALVYEVFAPNRNSECIDAKILNVSSGGVCIETKIPYEPGTVLSLFAHTQSTNPDIRIPASAEVRWVAPSWEALTDGRLKVGLKFLTKSY